MALRHAIRHIKAWTCHWCKEIRFKWILMSGTITSGKCCLQLSFTNIHLTFGSVASETESPAGISAPAAAIFGCHFCPRSPSVCFRLLSLTFSSPHHCFYMWNMWKEISCLQYLWIWELCYMSGGIFCNTYSNINTTNRFFIIYRKCLQTEQQYLPQIVCFIRPHADISLHIKPF